MLTRRIGTCKNKSAATITVACTVLAAFLVRDTLSNREAVAATAGRVAQSPKNEPSDEVLSAVAGLVQDRGYVVFSEFDLAQDDRERFDPA